MAKFISNNSYYLPYNKKFNNYNSKFPTITKLSNGKVKLLRRKQVWGWNSMQVVKQEDGIVEVILQREKITQNQQVWQEHNLEINQNNHSNNEKENHNSQQHGNTNHTLFQNDIQDLQHKIKKKQLQLV
eukprot:TRINITY_DN2565_c0_g2_i1.p1 TRINITY_DN2565_c0_g2~~TRINITY_DN2565_c0_g2_i1.p1  ORF type:complete len:129 (-),score=0.45 TRINITY_DN2565_c0_g2_i1:37-423(-)